MSALQSRRMSAWRISNCCCSKLKRNRPVELKQRFQSIGSVISWICRYDISVSMNKWFLKIIVKQDRPVELKPGLIWTSQWIYSSCLSKPMIQECRLGEFKLLLFKIETKSSGRIKAEIPVKRISDSEIYRCEKSVLMNKLFFKIVGKTRSSGWIKALTALEIVNEYTYLICQSLLFRMSAWRISYCCWSKLEQDR